MSKARTFTFDTVFPLVALSIERSCKATRGYASRSEIIRGLLDDPNGRKYAEAAQRKRPRKMRLERVAGNMVDWFSQRWTMRDEKWESYRVLFMRAKDGPRWSYKPRKGVGKAEVIFEGAMVQRSVNTYERSALARMRCIDKYGTRCYICRFTFGTRYGRTFDRLILVHHLRPLGEIRRKHRVRPIKDLRPVCANCHTILHTRTPAYSISELLLFLRRAKGRLSLHRYR